MINDNSNKNDYYTVDEIINRRKVNGKYEYLIKWKGYAGQNTWEPFQNLQSIKDVIKEYDELYETKKKKKNQIKNRKTFLRHKRKKTNDNKENKNKKDLNKERDGYDIPYIIVDDTIEKILNVSKEDGDFIAEFLKKDINGDIIKEKMKTKELKKINPWVLINFYESKIRFNKEEE